MADAIPAANAAPAPIEQTPTENQIETPAAGDETTPPAAAAPITPKEAKAIEKQLKKFKIKVNGKEEDMEVDLNDESSLQKHLQMSRASQVSMQQAAELRKSAEEFITLLKTNPRKVLSNPNINVDLKKLAQEYIDEQIANAQKTPEQLETEKIKREFEELQDKVKKEEETRKQKEFERLTKDHEEKIQVNIEAALKTSDLPKTPYTVRKMAEMMMLALQNNVDLSPQDLAPIIRKQMQSDIKELFGAASDDVLEELVGKERISSIRKKKIAAVQNKQVAQTATSVKPAGGKAPEKKPEESKKIDMKKWLNS